MARENLKAARKAAKLSQKAVADYLGVDVRYYKKIESGENIGGIWIWDALEDYFAVNQRVLREIHPDKEGNL